MKFQLLLLSLLVMNISNAQYSAHRTLLIFGYGEQATLTTQQVQLLQQDSAGIKDRDIEIAVVKQSSGLLKQYKVSEKEFTVILVGKDRGEKHRTHKLLPSDSLYAIIDVMPMRRAEMKRKH
jgi:hypothetical protein